MSLYLPPSSPHTVLTLRPSQARSLWGNTFSLIFLSLSQRYCVQRVWALSLFYFYLQELEENTAHEKQWEEKLLLGWEYLCWAKLWRTRWVAARCLGSFSVKPLLCSFMQYYIVVLKHDILWDFVGLFLLMVLTSCNEESWLNLIFYHQGRFQAVTSGWAGRNNRWASWSVGGSKLREVDQ